MKQDRMETHRPIYVNMGILMPNISTLGQTWPLVSLYLGWCLVNLGQLEQVEINAHAQKSSMSLVWL